jgi:GTP-sensing pleiotropic transcriptional regulator CodY
VTKLVGNLAVHAKKMTLSRIRGSAQIDIVAPKRMCGNDTFSASELIDFTEKKKTKRTLERSHQLEHEYGLSKMTLEEINAEVKVSSKVRALRSDNRTAFQPAMLLITTPSYPARM